MAGTSATAGLEARREGGGGRTWPPENGWSASLQTHGQPPV